MWNHLKAMKTFLIRALVVAAISAFVLSFLISIIYNRRSNVELQGYYSSEEKYRLDFNSVTIEKLLNDWKKDFDFFSGAVSSNSDISQMMSGDGPESALPKWLERQMLHSGYTSFEYYSLEEIMYKQEDELPLWLAELPDDLIYSSMEDLVFVSWSPADLDPDTTLNYFRISRPIWFNNKQNGLADGVYSFIYPAEKLITGHKLHQGAEISHMVMTDSSTRVIAEFDDRPSRIAIRAIQEVRDAVNSAEEGYVRTARGMYFWRQIDLPDGMSGVGLFTSDGSYYLISEIVAGTDAYKVMSNSGFFIFIDSLVDSLVPFIILLVFGCGVVFLLTYRKHQQIRAKYLSEYDQMSGALNRYTGLRKIQKVWEESENLREISICFIDINGLKQVNDLLGHDCGDDLIKTVSHAIIENIRRGDFVIRMGGDEFLIVLPGVPAEQAELIWVRIKEYMKQINRTENRSYLVSASHGISVIKADEKDKIEDYIIKADASMYEEKRRVKAKLRVIRDTE